MDSPIKFKIEKKIKDRLGRAGVLNTPHGVINTPAFITVGTKATVKALSPEEVKEAGAEAVLANTYHLYLEPGEELIKNAGGIHKFMNWNGPTFTDSGGFQVFSLGVAMEEKTGKFGIKAITPSLRAEGAAIQGMSCKEEQETRFSKIDEDGVTFKSHIDGSSHRFTPEKSINIQHNIGADIIFAFDECTSPLASYEYQKEAMDRTHRWAERSLTEHKKLGNDKQGLFGIVQGGRFEDLRKESAKIISEMGLARTNDFYSGGFDGFGIGGSFEKEDVYNALLWVNEILPENKPRHFLGIGAVEDLFGGVENGVDTFDCVAPTRMGRNGALQTKDGRININNAKFRNDFSPIEEGCGCYACKNYTRAYLAHLFRAEELLAYRLASIHNIYFNINLVKKIRQSILDDNFFEFKKEFLERYGK